MSTVERALIGTTPLDLEKTIRRMKLLGLKQWLLEELSKAFNDARKGKTGTYDEHNFELFFLENLVNLRDSILEERYRPGASSAFIVFEPKVREIFAAPFRDRVVHHFLYRLQAGWWDRRFIYDSYSCRIGKGTLFGAKRLRQFMMKATDNLQHDAMIIKLDIQGYFMSLPRDGLYKRVLWGLKQQFKDVMNDPMGYQLYKICAFLWKVVLYDEPILKARKKGPRKNWSPKVLPPAKSLYCQPLYRGIVIGNLTSQLVSNIYLDRLDKYVMNELGYTYYGRYVDDFFIVVPEEKYAQAKADVRKIERFLKDELGLVLHPTKRYYQSVYRGASFLGMRVYPKCLFPADRLQRNFKKAAREIAWGEGSVESLVSYIGLMKHMDAKKYLAREFEKWGWG